MIKQYSSFGDVAVAANVSRLGEGCLTDAQFSHEISMAAFAKPLLYAVCFNFLCGGN